MGFNQNIKVLGALGFSVPQTPDGYIEAIPLFGCQEEPECQELSRQCVELISLAGHPSADVPVLYKAFEVKALSQKWDLLIIAEKIGKTFDYKVFWIKRAKRFAWEFLSLLVGFVLICVCSGCLYSLWKSTKSEPNKINDELYIKDEEIRQLEKKQQNMIDLSEELKKRYNGLFDEVKNSYDGIFHNHKRVE